jgi:AraC-like DNA-binding protein
VAESEVPENSTERKFIEECNRILEEHLDEFEFNREAFAVELNMSLSSLNRKLKAVADRSPSAFIQEYRIRRAAEWIRTTTESISDIAFKTGFDEPANFTRVFKKYFNMSPTQYRDEKNRA